MSGPVPPLGLSEWRSETTGDGAFRFNGFPEGQVTITILAPSPWLAPPPHSAAAGDQDVVVRVRKGGELRGRLVGQMGEPVADFDVETQLSARVPRRKAHTGADGTFLLGGLPENELIAISVHAPWGKPSTSPFLPRELRDLKTGGVPLEIPLRRGVFVTGRVQPPKAGARLSGRVVAAERWPGDADVRRYAEAAIDANDGSFSVGPLEAGPVVLYYEEQMGRIASNVPVEIVAPASEVQLLARMAVPVRVHVTGSPGKTQAWWNPREGRMNWLPRAVDLDGGVVIDGARDEPGLLYVAQKDGDGFALREGIRPSDGPFEVSLEPGASLEGRIDGLPADRTSTLVTIVAVRGELAVWGAIADDGSFRIRALPPGKYSLRLDRGPWAAAAEGVAAGTRGIVLQARAR